MRGLLAGRTGPAAHDIQPGGLSHRFHVADSGKRLGWLLGTSVVTGSSQAASTVACQELAGTVCCRNSCSASSLGGGISTTLWNSSMWHLTENFLAFCCSQSRLEVKVWEHQVSEHLEVWLNLPALCLPDPKLVSLFVPLRK